MRERRKWLWFVSVVVVGWFAYHAFTDDYGSFSVPESLDHIFYRINRGVSTTADDVQGGVEDTNRDSQRVFDGRMDRNDSRIDRDKGRK